MKLAFDLFPLLVFFVAFKLADIYAATTAAIVATVGQVVWLKVRRQPIPPPLWFSLVIVGVFGGATLLLHDETFVKMKPTALYWSLAAALVVGRTLLRRDFLKSMVGSHLVMPDEGWTL